MATITTLLAADPARVKAFIADYVPARSTAELQSLAGDATRIMRDKAYSRAQTVKARRQWGIRPTSVDQDEQTLRRLAFSIFERVQAELQTRG